MLLGGGPVYGRCFRRKLHIDRFTFSLIRPFEVRSVALGRIVAAGTLGFTALHHPPEKGAFAEVLQLLELPL